MRHSEGAVSYILLRAVVHGCMGGGMKVIKQEWEYTERGDEIGREELKTRRISDHNYIHFSCWPTSCTSSSVYMKRKQSRLLPVFYCCLFIVVQKPAYSFPLFCHRSSKWHNHFYFLTQISCIEESYKCMSVPHFQETQCSGRKGRSHLAITET